MDPATNPQVIDDVAAKLQESVQYAAAPVPEGAQAGVLGGAVVNAALRAALEKLRPLAIQELRALAAHILQLAGQFGGAAPAQAPANAAQPTTE